jgi:hypothetical protein
MIRPQIFTSPSQFGNIPPSSPPGFYRGSSSFYQPPSQQQHQSLGIFARIKNSLTAAGSALGNAFDFQSNEDDASSSAQYAAAAGGSSSGRLGSFPTAFSQAPDMKYAPGYSVGSPNQRSQYSAPPPGISGYGPPVGDSAIIHGMQRPSSPSTDNDGILGKMFNRFGADNSQRQSQSATTPPGADQYRSYPSAPAAFGAPNIPGAPDRYHQHGQQNAQFQSATPFASPPHGSNYPSMDAGQRDPQSSTVLPDSSASFELPRSFQQHTPAAAQQYLGQYQAQQHPGATATAPSAVPHATDFDWLNSIPSEPQVSIHEDSIVFILKPKSFYRKKFEMMRAGPSALQVFTDFERVLTRFKMADGNRAMTTEEILESSGAVTQEGIAEMQRAVDDMEQGLMSAAASAVDEFDILSDSGNENGKDGSLNHVYEEGAKNYHQALAARGHVHLGHALPIIRSRLSQLGLRDNWKDFMQMLSSRSVPLYVFSSGFGDIVTMALAAVGLTPKSAEAGNRPPDSLPGNVRVISNFFRAAPDGIIRAFSQPTVHDRNKNVTTAAMSMGMPVPQRPHALVLTAHEDDAERMTDGLQGIKEKLTIGYMEVTEDLPQRLPLYLNSFDAVILGDGSFKFIASVLEEILQTPIPSKAAAGSSSGGFTGRLPNLSFGLRRGLGILLNNENQQPQQQQQQQVQPPVYSTPYAQNKQSSVPQSGYYSQDGQYVPQGAVPGYSTGMYPQPGQPHPAQPRAFPEYD